MMKIVIFLSMAIIGCLAICAPSEITNDNPATPCILDGNGINPFNCNFAGFICSDGEVCDDTAMIDVETWNEFEDANWCAQEPTNPVTPGVGGQTNAVCQDTTQDQNSACSVGGADVSFWPNPANTSLQRDEVGGWAFPNDTHPICFDALDPMCEGLAGLTFTKNCRFVDTQGYADVFDPDGDGQSDIWALELAGQGLEGAITKDIATTPGRTTDLKFSVLPHPDSFRTMLEVTVPTGVRYFRIESFPGDWSAQVWRDVSVSFTASSTVSTVTIRARFIEPSNGHSVYLTNLRIESFGSCCDCANPVSCEDTIQNFPPSDLIPNLCTEDVCTDGFGCLHVVQAEREKNICAIYYDVPPPGWPIGYTTLSPIVPTNNRGWHVWACACGDCIFSQFYPSAAMKLNVQSIFVIIASIFSVLFFSF